MGEQHGYSITLRSGDFLEITLDQEGDNLGLVLRDPAGREVQVVDTPNGSFGRERLFAVATTAGDHRIEVWLQGGVGGGYTLEADRRPATRADRQRAEACSLLYRPWWHDESGEEAVRDTKRALAHWRELGDRYLEAVSLLRLGQLHRTRNDPGGAETILQQAQDLVEEGGFRDLVPEVLLELGASMEDAGRPESALTAFEGVWLAAREAKDAKDRWRQGVARNELGRLLFDERILPWTTLGHLNQAVKIFVERNDPEQRAHALHNRGQILNWLGRHDDALRDLEDALELKLDILDRGRASHEVDPQDELSYAKTLRELGWVQIWRGEDDAAEDHLLEALQMVQEKVESEVEEHDRLRFVEEAATCHDRLGTLYRRQGRFDEARRFSEAAVEGFEELEHELDKAHALSNLGRIYLDLDLQDQAIEKIDRALSVFEDEENPSGQAYALANRARVRRRLERSRDAESDLRDALQLHEELRDETRSPGLRASYLDSIYDHFQLYVDVAMTLAERGTHHDGQQAWAVRALEMVERSRARSLLDLLGQLKAERRVESSLQASIAETGEKRELLDELWRVNQEVRKLERAEFLGEDLEGGQATRKAEARDRRREILQELEHLEGWHVPDRTTEGNDLAKPRDLETLRQALDPDTALVVFALGDERGFVWLVQAQGAIEWRSLPGRADLGDQVEKLMLRLRESSSVQTPRSLEDELASLGDRLLGSFLSDPSRDPGPGLPQRLVVLPDGPLHYLPFGALRLEGRYLVETHEITRLPSASVLLALRERRELQERREPGPLPSGLLSVIADPVFQPADSRLQGEAQERAWQAFEEGEEVLEDLPRLEATAREADSALSWVSQTPASCSGDNQSFEARPELFREGHLQDFRLLHLATHAVIEDESPELSRVVLSQFDRQGNPKDGSVRSLEIAELELNADLVVLSACETALGEELRGEGLVGLPQSFFQAGADRVLVSLWKVDDDGTADLMKHLYRQMLGEGLAPGAALREAQRELLRGTDYPDPYFWAPFVLIGDWAPLPSTLLESPCLQHHEQEP